MADRSGGGGLVTGPARSCFRAAPGVMRAWMASAVALAVVLPVLTVAGLPPVLTVPVLGFGDLVTASVLVFLAVESALLFGSARLCDESDERWLRRTLADPGFYVTEAAVLA